MTILTTGMARVEDIQCPNCKNDNPKLLEIKANSNVIHCTVCSKDFKVN